MEKEQLQKQYARILLGLANEAKTMAASSPNSKLFRSSRQTVLAAGKTLTLLQIEWMESHRISAADPILPELNDYAGFTH